MNDLDQPLDQTHLAELNRGLIAADAAIAAINRATAAGIDCGERLEQTRSERAKLLAVKRTYFPGQ